MQCETDETAAPAHWYVAYTEPRREAHAGEQLGRQGYLTYLPLYRGVEPLFPRYLFFRPASAAQSIAPARSTRGVQSVIRFGSVYAQVSPGLLDAIREQEYRSQQDGPDAAHRLPLPGQRVRVQDSASALAGFEGLVHASAARRVIVLMEILGRQTPVRLQAEKLVVV